MELEGDAIEKILDHKEVPRTEDENGIENDEGFDEPEVVTKYWVKWQGFSHLHNTYPHSLPFVPLSFSSFTIESWDTANYLAQFKGYKKLVNYMKNVQKEADWRQYSSREEIEQADVNREMQLDAYPLSYFQHLSCSWVTFFYSP